MTTERTSHTAGLPGVSDAEVTRLASKAIAVLLSEKAVRRPSLESRLDLLCDAFLSDREDTRHAILARIRQDGVSPEDMIDVLLPEVARIAGSRWMADEISFAEVTIVSARVQEAVRSLSRIPPGQYPNMSDDTPQLHSTRPRILLIIPRTEEHTLGAFVAADQFRRQGCDVDFAMDLHPRQIAEKVRKTRYQMIGITAAGRRTLASARELVKTVRASITRVTPIILGGSVVDGDDRLKTLTGVDYVVEDVPSALKVCGLVEQDGGAMHPASLNKPNALGETLGKT